MDYRNIQGNVHKHENAIADLQTQMNSVKNMNGMGQFEEMFNMQMQEIDMMKQLMGEFEVSMGIF